MKRSELKRDPEKLRAFQQRGRVSSAESLRQSAANPRNGKPAAARAVSAASPAQRAKVRQMGFCVACRKPLSAYRAIDPAHVVDRSIGGCDHEDCVVPLCRVVVGGGCHQLYDDHKLDLLPVLERDGAFRCEQAHAVMHLGLVGAYERVTGYGWKRGQVGAGSFTGDGHTA